MLQFIAAENDRYSIPEQVQMAIEGGCQWVQLHLPGMDDAQVREVAQEIIPLCRENGTILTVENRPEAAKELGIHGVHLTDKSLNARQVREQLGPEAIVGVQVTTPQAVLMLKGADIDYATVDPSLTLTQAADLIATAAQGGNAMPVVIEGDFTAGNVADALKAGASGVAVGAAIGSADDPVAATAALINALNSLQ